MSAWRGRCAAEGWRPPTPPPTLRFALLSPAASRQGRRCCSASLCQPLAALTLLATGWLEHAGPCLPGLTPHPPTPLPTEGVLYAEKDFNLPKHPEIDVPNLEVIKLMQSFKSKEYVTERYAWRHYYWCA